MSDYPNREKENETTLEYATRIARCATSDLVLAGLITENKRAETVKTIAEQIFARLAVGDEPPPRVDHSKI